VRRNLDVLAARGVRFVDPGEGFLACGWIGKGRLAEPDEVVAAAEAILNPSTTLAGRRVIVTAGPTYEDLDPVRYIGNRSSGRMGYAIATEAARRGAAVTLVSGPSSLSIPAGVEAVRVRSAAEMHAAVMARAQDANVIVMAAAVGDYAPARAEAQKISKDADSLTFTLRRTPDILAELGALRESGRLNHAVLVGFAAETEDLLMRARAKRQQKNIDLIVANDVSRTDAGFDTETNQVTFVTADGQETLPLLPKARVAAALIDRIEALLHTRAAARA
jgi:phosphopantothenoylcysteine decarboxylase/phosphopantothenate--cysteine ligase